MDGLVGYQPEDRSVVLRRLDDQVLWNREPGEGVLEGRKRGDKIGVFLFGKTEKGITFEISKVNI